MVAPKNVNVHLAPFGGLQTYKQPYPRFTEDDEAGPMLNDGQEVEVGEVRGTWVQVAFDGDIIGWVDGRKLVPPVGPPVRMAATSSTQLPPPTTSTSTPTITLTAGTIVGIVASIGIIVGASLRWIQVLFGGVSAFDTPVQFLFNNHTRSQDPNVGIFLVALGIVGMLLSLFARGAIWRVFIGILAIVIAAVFLIQMVELVSGTSRSFTDFTGAGPWVTGVSGLVLMLSAMLN